MNRKYIVSSEYLEERGLNLNDYALTGTLIPAIIQLGLDLLVTRICYLNDSIKGEQDIENLLGDDDQKINTFFKAQYRVIYNMIFQNETSPVDPFIDNIIAHELEMAKINGWQKGVYFKQNQ